MNDSISETEVNGCEVGKIHVSKTNCTTDNVRTIVTFPSSNKNIRSGCMKMLGHGVISSKTNIQNKSLRSQVMSVIKNGSMSI